MFISTSELHTLRQRNETTLLNSLFIIKKNIQQANRKYEFLSSIKSGGKNNYKRYLGTPLRYAGGKSLATGYLAELLPDNLTKIVSPFFGGGSFEIACSSEMELEVIGYDVFDILVNYWQQQIENPLGLYNELKKFDPTRQGFTEVKKILKQHWDKEKIIKDKLYLAALYYFNHNTSYGPHFLGSPSSVYLDEKRYDIILEKVRNFAPKNLTVECMPFEQTIPLHKDDLLYCDPPYYLGEDSKTFVGMYPHRNFPIHHNGFKHDKLRDLLHEHKGGFILSYNYCSTIIDWYKDCNMYSPEWQYTFSQGDTRIGMNRLENNNGSHIKKSHEIIIWRYPND
jgi:DNA adenine methylase